MRAAIVQLCSTDRLSENLEAAESGIIQAREAGARLVALPENFAFMRREGEHFPCAQGPGGEIVRALSSWAKSNQVWLLGGTFPESIPGEDRVFNTCTLFDPGGTEVARYRKIHLFDVSLGSDAQDQYRESTHFKAGTEVVCAESEFGPIGLSICYDLRFPELYTTLSTLGARWIVVPSAFTRPTGEAHWEVLLRARAIESQAFVLAPAQCGEHSPDRASHGHSLMIDPWGQVIARAANEPAVISAECDLSEIDRIRKAIPVLTNRRLQSSSGA